MASGTVGQTPVGTVRLGDRWSRVFSDGTRSDFAIGLAVAALAFAVYSRTLTPSLSYFSPDSNELVAVAYQLGLAHPTGYPLYTWLAKAFTLLPVGDVAHRVNLLSAVAGAGTAGLLFAVARLIRIGRPAALFAALLFAFSRTFWSQTVVAEVHAPNAFVLALGMYLLLRWGKAAERGAEGRTHRGFAAFAFVHGLSLGTHISSIAFAPAFAVYAGLTRGRRFWRSRELAYGAAAFVAGCLQFLWIPLRAGEWLRATGGSGPLVVPALVYRYTFGAAGWRGDVAPEASLPDRWATYLGIMPSNLTWLGVTLGAVGLGVMFFRQRRTWSLLVLMLLGHLALTPSYQPVELAAYAIPGLMLATLFIAQGAEAVLAGARAAGRRLAGWRAPALPPRWAGRLAAVALAVAVALPLAGQLRANYAANDRSRDTTLNDFYRTVYAWLPAGSKIWNRGAVLGYGTYYYQIVYGARTDLSLPMLKVALGGTLETAQAGEKAFATVRPGESGPYMPPLPSSKDVWYVPVLVAPAQTSNGPTKRELVLYSLSTTPPVLAADAVAVANGGAETDLAPDLALAGNKLDPRSVRRGQTVDITYYWRVQGAGARTVYTRLTGPSVWTETHDLGFGNLDRYLAAQTTTADNLLVEQYQLVIPHGATPGVYRLEVGAREGPEDVPGANEPSRYAEVGTIEVR